MPSQALSSVENNFTRGLITESTGLNFPENAATDTSNCNYTLIGDVSRRLGINTETNWASTTAPSEGGRNTYIWSNAGGDGNTKILVRQDGQFIRFYRISAATVTSPVSTKILTSVIDLNTFIPIGGSFDATLECEFSDGNGYLFGYQPTCEPFYCTFVNGTVTANQISVQIRDFEGVDDSVPLTSRPLGLTDFHAYNLQNQGWKNSPAFSATSGTLHAVVSSGTQVYQVTTGLPILGGDQVLVSGPVNKGIFGSDGITYIMRGVVSGYSGTNLTLTIVSNNINTPFLGNSWTITPYQTTGQLSTWHTQIGNYPSNADVWWYFKDASDNFNPLTTIGNTSIGTGAAPKGSFVLAAFNQQKVNASGLDVPNVATTVRPKTGCWFQGRVWYAGVDASLTDVVGVSHTWTENIYFSQIVQTTKDFGNCYQTNDPTSQQLFDVLPTDGGVIQIQGMGSVYKLFPIQNGLLVFAANGIWFITGSQGIGFAATDYTITKISSIQSISSTSFINVQGLPYFWNEEGIYMVSPQQGGGLGVNPITVGTIQTFYDAIPVGSKKYARGDYHPIDYIIQWTYKSTPETSVNDRYNFDTILNFNTYNKAFFPYTVSNSVGNSAGNQAFINGVKYISYPQITTGTPEAGFKYPTSFTSSGTRITIAEENDEAFVDWNTFGAGNYISFFVTGYKLHGQAQRRFQMPYIYMFNRVLGDSISYNIQGLWDYASDRNSNRWSVPQLVTVMKTHFSSLFRRHRIRGRGIVLQIKVYSVDGQPFDIMGWSILENQNTGV